MLEICTKNKKIKNMYLYAKEDYKSRFALTLTYLFVQLFWWLGKTNMKMTQILSPYSLVKLMFHKKKSKKKLANVSQYIYNKQEFDWNFFYYSIKYI